MYVGLASEAFMYFKTGILLGQENLGIGMSHEVRVVAKEFVTSCNVAISLFLGFILDRPTFLCPSTLANFAGKNRDIQS